MRLILQYWNTLINTTLNPEQECISSLTDASIQMFKLRSNEEQEGVRNLFLEGMIQRTKLKDKQQWVQINQAMLIRLMDKLFSYAQTKQQDSRFLDLYETISSHLENILNFIKDFFGNYFDHNEKLPLSYLIISLEQLSIQIKQLQETVQPCKPYIHALEDILVNNFNIFLQEKKNGATYNEMFYQRDLTHQLLNNKTIGSENSINEVLFDYIAYLKEKLDDLTESLETTREKIAALRFEQKKFNQLPVRLIGNLNPDTSSLIEQINHWIEEEIKFLDANHLQNETPESVERGRIYIHVPFKGAEIYLLHKAFIDSGGAPGETYKSLFEKTATHLTNKSQKGFSSESLQKNSDKINYESKENVKRFLQKMIRNIDSY